MRNIAVDAGPIIAFCNAGDAHHGRVVDWLKANKLPMVTNWLAIGEAFHLLSDDPATARRMVAWVVRAMIVDERGSLEIPRVLEILEKYESLPADLTDAALVAMCERRKILEVASLDSDFDVYRTKSRTALVNVLARQNG